MGKSQVLASLCTYLSLDFRDLSFSVILLDWGAAVGLFLELFYNLGVFWICLLRLYHFDGGIWFTMFCIMILALQKKFVSHFDVACN